MAKLIKEKRYRIEVPAGKKKERLDVFLASQIENATRSRIQKLIEANLVKVNGNFVKPSYKVLPDDFIEATIPISPRPEETEPEDIPLNIVYEDEDVIVINKQAGISVHPSINELSGTIANALIAKYPEIKNVGEDPVRPGIVHRLDKNTSRLFFFSKNQKTF